MTALATALTISIGCGKRKPPLPPVERVAQRVQISGIQRGNRVILTWQMPARNAPDGSVLNINKVEVYRLAEPLNSPLTLSEEEFASKATLIAASPIADSDFARKTLNHADTLELIGQPVRLRYSIRFVNSSGQRAAFSNFLLIEPAARIAGTPSELNVSVSSEALLLRWKQPEANINGSKPANILGYNIYRQVENANFALLNKTPINLPEFADKTFDFDKNYKYFVRTVSVGSNGEPVESLDSNQAEIKPKDTFAPSAPTAITLAAAPNNISIFFVQNPEKDIAGYKIYRSENEALPKDQWKLLTPALLTTNTFQDKAVETGKTYFYYIKAVDKAGNISEPSDVVSETAP